MERSSEDIEEEGEDYIDLEDISIYDNDPNYEPTEEEVIYYAERLGFDVENDPKEFLTIAYQALKAPLPDNWRRALLKSKDELVYINLEDQTIHLYTDIDEMAYKYYCEEKEKFVKTKQEKESRSKVVPRTKIPPLNPEKNVEKGKNKASPDKKKKGNNLNNNANNFYNVNSKDNFTSIIPPESSGNKYDPYNIPTKYDQGYNAFSSNTIDEVGPGVPNVVSNNKSKNSEHKNHIHNTQTNDINFINSSNVNTNNNVEINSDAKSTIDKKENVNFNFNINENSKLKPNLNTDSFIETDFMMGKDDKDIPPSLMEMNMDNDIDIIDPIETFGKRSEPEVKNKNKSEASLEIKKKDYFNAKLKELKDFETNIRETYNESVQDYKQKRTQFKMNLSEEYERKIALNKRKNKDTFDSMMTRELKEFESELAIQMDKECKEYGEQLEKINSVFSDPESDDINAKIKELEKSKISIQNEIQLHVALKEKQKRNVADSDLNDALSLLQDKYEIERKNLNRKYEMLEREIEVEEEEKFNREIEMMQKQTNYNKELQEKIIKSSHNKLLGDYQKALDEDYSIQTKTIQKEFEEKFRKDLNNFKTSLEKEKEEKVVMFRKEIVELEKEYYVDLNGQREDNKSQSQVSDKKLNTKFENVLNNYDNLKKNIFSKTDQICLNIVKFLKNIVETQDISEEYFSLENKFEEYIMNLIDDNTIDYQRKKASYELLEAEYRDKSLLLDYYLEICSYLVRFLKENPTKKIDKDTNSLVQITSAEEKVYDELINFAKEKQKEYKIRNLQFKDKKLFEILGNNNMNNVNNFLSDNKAQNMSYTAKVPFNPDSLLISNFKVSHQNSSRNRKNVFNLNDNFGNNSNNNQTIQKSQQTFNHNKSINIRNESKVPLSTERYNEENAYENQNQSINNNNTYNSNNNNNISSYSLYLTNDIISKLDQTDKNIIPIINDFIVTEQDRLEREFVDLTNRKKIFEDLSSTIDNLKVVSNTGSPISFHNPTLLSYIQILEEDREKIRKDERNFYLKKNIYDKIESVIEDCFIYIRNNINFDSKKEMISDKLILIKNQIDDYYEAYSEMKRMSRCRNFVDNMNNGGNLTNVSNLQNNMQNNLQNIPCNSKIGTSTDFFISQKINKDNNNNFNTENNFSNFYTAYTRKSLHEDLILPSTNSFFQYKKTKFDVDTKLDLLKTRLNNSNYSNKHAY